MRISLAFVLLAMVPALAGPREETQAEIARCTTIADDRTYLDCLYGAAQPLRAHLGLSPAPLSQTRLVPPAPGMALRTVLSAPPSTGTLGNVLGGNTTPGWLESFSFDDKGLFTVTLSNGEIWRQETSDRARAHWRGRPSDYGIKLVRDTGGRNGQLSVRGDDAPYLVRRLR